MPSKYNTLNDIKKPAPPAVVSMAELVTGSDDPDVRFSGKLFFQPFPLDGAQEGAVWVLVGHVVVLAVIMVVLERTPPY